MKQVKNQVYKGTVVPFRSRKGYRYPNAAESRYMMDRLADGLLTAATSVGIISALVFVMML